MGKVMTIQATTGKFTTFLDRTHERSRPTFGGWLARLISVGRRRRPAPTYRSDWYRDDFKTEFDRRLLGQ